jgi:hypothetical protein
MAAIKNETQILDRGYNAVRQMAKELVGNGATLADILFHANQVWHEFKVGALQAGLATGKTGMYIDQYNADATNKIIRADKRYAGGTDDLRIAQVREKLRAGETLEPAVRVTTAKAGK